MNFDFLTERWSKSFIARYDGAECVFCAELVEAGQEVAFVRTEISDDLVHEIHRPIEEPEPELPALSLVDMKKLTEE